VNSYYDLGPVYVGKNRKATWGLVCIINFVQALILTFRAIRIDAKQCNNFKQTGGLDGLQ
jgi:hypothetical protein